MGNISSYIDLKGMNNTRDLGGMQTKDGKKIKQYMLIRSARLNKLKDMDWFTENVGLVVDFRSSREVSEGPDPDISGVENLHLPIFEAQASGVTRDKKSNEGIMAVLDPKISMERMESLYLRFVTDEFSLSQYRRFICLLFEPREKAIVWHCTAGKDRTGIGALFIQELLGIGRDDIMADYLATNAFLSDETQEHLDARAAKLGRPLEQSEERAMRYFLEAFEKYPLGLYARVDELYGSFDGFIRDGLKISDCEREALRQMYLE